MFTTTPKKCEYRSKLAKEFVECNNDDICHGPNKGRCVYKNTPDDSYKELMGDYGDSPVLRKAVETVDGRDKQEHYGPPEESMRRIGLIWSGILGADITPEKVALMMLGLKAARLSIDPRHFDSLVDAGGYVRILERLSK